MANRDWISAGELMRHLENDPEWVAKRTAKDSRRIERARALTADEAPIILELASVGITVSSVYDFVGKQPASEVAIPILIRHLSVEHHERIREGLIRGLSRPSARKLAFEPLRNAFLEERDPALRWVLANALSSMARLGEVEDLPGIEAFAALFDKNQ